MINKRNQINPTSLKQKKEINCSITVLDHHQKAPETREIDCLQFVKVPYFNRHASGPEQENDAIDICI